MVAKSESDLYTWQEIADYLQVSVRTAQNYEQVGLPVHRLSGYPRVRVLARKSEIDRWKAERSAGLALQVLVSEQESSSGAVAMHSTPLLPRVEFSRAQRRWVAYGVICAAVLFLCFAAYSFWPQLSGQPVAYEIQVGTLRAIDSEGRQVWKRQFAQPFSVLHYQEPQKLERGIFADLDGDGRNEFLFLEFLQNWRSAGAVLRCFSSKGRELWSYTPGRSVVSTGDGRKYSPPYYISAISAIASPGEPTRVVVSSNHNLRYPTQITVLDARGRMTGEYWHPGHLLHVGHADLNGNGKQELLLAGVNDGSHAATLLVFDMNNVSGTAEVSDSRYQLLGFPKGSEKAVVLFPRTCVSSSLPYNRVRELQVRGNRIFVVVAESVSETTDSLIIYELDFQLNVLSAFAPASYDAAHRRMEREGILHHRYSASELETFRKAVVVRKALSRW